ncbi:MAG: DUF488 domain-containing protein [Balneola sp.]|nr:MAG: DUF488 domain-containing protein [Balneola sp.]
MFYRRKILLSLLQVFDGQLDKLSLNKLMLIVSMQQENPSYDFIPYKFGCYSFSMKADLNKMQEIGLIIKNETAYQGSSSKNFFKELNDSDKKIIRNIKSKFYGFDSRELMEFTYKAYPYFAINSLVANDVLDSKSYGEVVKKIPYRDEITLFTIGYEGISLESYFNRLIKNDVKLLIDVRKNATSMKYGFSKKTLSYVSQKLKIKYLHIPELGINSSYRKSLDSKEDYKSLFDMYRKENLPNTKKEQEHILSLLKEEKRVALTCFEADKCECHRSHLADSIKGLEGFSYSVIHL